MPMLEERVFKTADIYVPDLHIPLRAAGFLYSKLYISNITWAFAAFRIR